MALVWANKKGYVIAMFGLATLGATFAFLGSGAMGLLVNQLVDSSGTNEVTPIIVLFIGFVILASLVPAFMMAVWSYLDKLFWIYLEKFIETTLLEKHAGLDIAIHENPEYNDLLNRVRENGVWRAQQFMNRLFFILRGSIEVLIAAVILVISNWWVFAIIVVGTTPQLLVEMKYGKQVWGIHSSKASVRRRFWDIQGYFRNLSSLLEIKLFNKSDHFLRKVGELFDDFQEEERKTERKKIFEQSLAILVSQVAMAFATVWFVIEVVHGTMQVGTLVFVLASVGSLRESLASLFASLGRQYQDSLFVTDIFKVLDIKPVVKQKGKRKRIVLDPNKTPDIVFENVSFTYPGTKREVLSNINLTIPAGQKLALIGINGAGKTTLVKLLCRFYDPTGGRILVDGHNLRDVDLSSWHEILGIIFQEYGHYNFPVKESIALGRVDASVSEDRARDSAIQSEADAFISEWDDGYNQMLGKEFEGGVEPSIGQWQKLALAKMFYRDARIMIMDEPTAAIDAEAEARIFEKLEQLPSDRTVILISHRFSTVRNAHQIVVLKENEIVEAGTHADLMKEAGTYAKLFTTQAKGYQY